MLCSGFLWQGFGSGEAIGVGSARRIPKLPHVREGPCCWPELGQEALLSVPLGEQAEGRKNKTTAVEQQLGEREE